MAAFGGSGVILNRTGGVFHINNDGWYIVSSRLAFNAPIKNTEIVLFGQRIYLNDRTEPLLEDRHAVGCLGEDEQSLPCYTSQLSMIVYLTSGSMLSVHARPINQISNHLRNSFIDLTRIV